MANANPATAKPRKPTKAEQVKRESDEKRREVTNGLFRKDN